MTRLPLLACAMLLAACASDPQAQFVQAEASYTVLLQSAASYVALPRCGSPGATQVCSDQKVVNQIRPAANSAQASVIAAENTVTSSSNSSAVQLAIAAATNATQALTVIMQQYSIPTAPAQVN